MAAKRSKKSGKSKNGDLLEKIRGMVIQGIPDGGIVKILEEQGENRQEIVKGIEQIWDEVKTGGQDADTERRLMSLRFEELYRKAVEDGDWRIAYKALQDMERYAPKGSEPEEGSEQDGEQVELAKDHLEALGIRRQTIQEMSRLAVQKYVESGQGKD